MQGYADTDMREMRDHFKKEADELTGASVI